MSDMSLPWHPQPVTRNRDRLHLVRLANTRAFLRFGVGAGIGSAFTLKFADVAPVPFFVVVAYQNRLADLHAFADLNAFLACLVAAVLSFSRPFLAVPGSAL